MIDTDGNLAALRQRMIEEEEHEARWKDCPECNGSGLVLVQLDGRDGDPDANYDEADCKNCGGSGEIEDWDDEDDA
jgi:DnaJ-class molecular chaperone